MSAPVYLHVMANAEREYRYHWLSADTPRIVRYLASGKEGAYVRFDLEPGEQELVTLPDVQGLRMFSTMYRLRAWHLLEVIKHRSKWRRSRPSCELGCGSRSRS